MSSNPEEPRKPKERDTMPLETLAYYEQYRSRDRWDRVLRFFQRVGEALGGRSGGRGV